MNIKRTIAAVGIVLATALSGFGATADAAQAPVAKTTLGSISATPSTGLTDGKKVSVKVSGFGSFTGTAKIIQCTAGVISDGTHPSKYCDLKHTAPIKISHGAGKGSYKIRVASFHAGLASQKCVKGGRCLILASTLDKSYAAFSQISFAS
ncbi:neocarzinostatin apoprotein domain-containing protein [Nocardioides sp. CN2-186]|uniref:neocarzinostatin apoprotein domain-containing protein n=1 Tax=Nocardioides tweenelious TaxID=3156607 RepID=UPI0032B466C7